MKSSRLVTIVLLQLLALVACSPSRQATEPKSSPSLQAERVWLEEMTSDEVGDALTRGQSRVIVPTGGVEQNGPYVSLGKHNIILHVTCERIAQELGDTLVAPILKYVPEGNVDPPEGHMKYPGTLSLRPETFRMTLVDVVSSLRAHGFREILLLGDSGGNQAVMKVVAEQLAERWVDCQVIYIPQYYNYPETRQWLLEQGIQELPNEVHEEICFSAQMMAHDPSSIRFEERKDDRGGVVINGHRFASPTELATLGEKIIERRVKQTVEAIRRGRP